MHEYRTGLMDTEGTFVSSLTKLSTIKKNLLKLVMNTQIRLRSRGLQANLHSASTKAPRGTKTGM